MTQHYLDSKISNEAVTQKSPQKKQRSMHFVMDRSKQFQRLWRSLWSCFGFDFPSIVIQVCTTVGFLADGSVLSQSILPLPKRSRPKSLCPPFRSEIIICLLIQLFAWHVGILQSHFSWQSILLHCMQLPERTRTQRKGLELRRKREP